MARLVVHPRETISFEEFCSTPGPAVALDGYVQGPSQVAGTHVTFDHHDSCQRFSTRATCEQVALALRAGLLRKLTPAGEDMEIHVNDADGDVCVSVWLLEHPERAADVEVSDLVALEGILDVTSGTLADVPAERLEQLEWVFEPYWRARPRVTVDASAQEMSAVIRAVCGRINEYLSGRAQRLPDNSGFELLDLVDGVAVVREWGPLARAKMRAEGIEVFVSAGDGPHGRSRVIVGRMSPFVPVDLEQVWDALNALESTRRPLTPGDAWGGGDVIGGSPRFSGTELDAGKIAEVVASCFRAPLGALALSR